MRTVYYRDMPSRHQATELAVGPCHRDIAPPQPRTAVAAGAANSAAVPSADDLDEDDTEPSANGNSTS